MSNYISAEKENAFGEALTAWKESSGWSDTRITAVTGLDRTTVSAIRRGKNQPQWRTRVLLWEKLPGFRRYCQRKAPSLLVRHNGDDEL